MTPIEYRERYCMTCGRWHKDANFQRHVTYPKGKKNVRLECLRCAENRKQREEVTTSKPAIHSSTHTKETP